VTSTQLPGKSSLSVPLTVACQLTRLVVTAWFIWVLVFFTIFWSDEHQVLHIFSELSGRALGPISRFQQAAGYLVSLVNILILAAFVVKVWQLIAYYIAGHIFDRQAVSTFRAIAYLAIVLYVADLVDRTITFAIVSNGGFTFWFNFYDVMHGAWALCLVMVAEVFSAGAAIAEEYSQIV